MSSAFLSQDDVDIPEFYTMNGACLYTSQGEILCQRKQETQDSTSEYSEQFDASHPQPIIMKNDAKIATILTNVHR